MKPKHTTTAAATIRQFNRLKDDLYKLSRDLDRIYQEDCADGDRDWGSGIRECKKTFDGLLDEHFTDAPRTTWNLYGEIEIVRPDGPTFDIGNSFVTRDGQVVGRVLSVSPIECFSEPVEVPSRPLLVTPELPKVENCEHEDGFDFLPSFYFYRCKNCKAV